MIDMSTLLMGPLATRILGDMGADVIKVEPLDGDPVRKIGPIRTPGMGPFFMTTNRNKRSLALDLKTPEGIDIMRRLLSSADVFLHNTRPQALARLGLDYAACRAINPGLVHVGAFGFDQDGPYASRPAYDDLIQGLSAIPSLIGRAGDHEPQYVPLAIVDRYVGTTVANAVLGALVHKLRTGQGQSVEVPMFETMVDVVMSDHMDGATFDPPLSPPGYPRSLARERRPYRTADGYICVMLYMDSQWDAFFDLVGSDLRSTDRRFRSITSRTEHASEVYRILESFLLRRPTHEWLADFEREDIPAAPLHTLDSILEDPHLEATGFFRWAQHPSQGAIRVMRHPSKWSVTPLEERCAAPVLGQHTEEILAECDLASEDIERLIGSGVARRGSVPGA